LIETLLCRWASKAAWERPRAEFTTGVRVIIIAAMTRGRVIGSRAGLPWSIPEEYEQFRAHVRGQAVIFGRKSYEIFGRDLPDSDLFVISRSAELVGVRVYSDVERAAAAARATGKTVFSAGGGSIYRLTLPMAKRMYLSIVKGDYEGDTLFPEFDESDWVISRRDDHAAFEFRVYDRCNG
jgi:dihydrofolate reductase